MEGKKGTPVPTSAPTMSVDSELQARPATIWKDDIVGMGLVMECTTLDALTLVSFQSIRWVTPSSKPTASQISQPSSLGLKANAVTGTVAGSSARTEIVSSRSPSVSA